MFIKLLSLKNYLKNCPMLKTYKIITRDFDGQAIAAFHFDRGSALLQPTPTYAKVINLLW